MTAVMKWSLPDARSPKAVAAILLLIWGKRKYVDKAIGFCNSPCNDQHVHTKTAEGIAREVGRRADSPFGRLSPLRVASPNSAFNSTSSPPMDLKLMVAFAGLANLKLGCARKHTSLHQIASAFQKAEQCQTRLVIYALF
jgi:hypothetical protein